MHKQHLRYPYYTRYTRKAVGIVRSTLCHCPKPVLLQIIITLALASVFKLASRLSAGHASRRLVQNTELIKKVQVGTPHRVSSRGVCTQTWR